MDEPALFCEPFNNGNGRGWVYTTLHCSTLQGPERQREIERLLQGNRPVHNLPRLAEEKMLIQVYCQFIVCRNQRRDATCDTSEKCYETGLCLVHKRRAKRKGVPD